MSNQKYDRSGFIRHFWSNVNKIRLDKGFSAQELATRSGLSRSILLYGLWEGGAAAPALKHLISLAYGFDFLPIQILAYDKWKDSTDEKETEADDFKSDAFVEIKPVSSLTKARTVLSEIQMKSVFIHALSYLGLDEEMLDSMDANESICSSDIDSLSEEYKEKERRRKEEEAKPVAQRVREYSQRIYREIEAKMEKKHLTKNRICKDLKMSYAFFYYQKDQEKSPDLFNLIRVLNYLGISMEDAFSKPLIEIKEEKKTPEIPEFIKNIILMDRMIEKTDYASRTQNIMFYLTSGQRDCIKDHIVGLMPAEEESGKPSEHSQEKTGGEPE